jgi:hypothetical protein
MGTTVTSSSGTTVTWDGSSLDVQGVDEVNIVQEPEPEPVTEGPEFSWIHPDDGMVPVQTAGGGGSPAPTPQVQESTPTTQPDEVATKPQSEPVDQKKLAEILKDYPKDIRDHVRFNPKMTDAYGKTGVDANGKLVIELGPAALKSPEILRSTLDHEAKHLQQARDGNYVNRDSPNALAAEAVNDLEAYRTELANAQRNGVPQEHIDQINEEIRINEEFLRRTAPEYYDRVKHGDFTLRPEDRKKISD